MDNRDEDSDSTAAERAFDALRAEVQAMRRALERLPDTLKKLAPIDYTETLGAIAKRLEILRGFMTAIEQHPAIRTTPAHYHQAITAAGDGLITQSVRELEGAKAAAVLERRELAAMIGTMRGKWKQWEWIAWTAFAGLVVGLMIAPMLARLLPFGWNDYVAAAVMNADRWTAGSALMQAGNPEAWDGLMEDFNLVKNNQVALAACHEAAAKTKKEQRCSIVVSAP